MGTTSCTWQRLNQLKRPLEVYQKESRAHLAFLMDLYREHAESGRLFIHEHPKVGRTNCDQCEYGQEVVYGEFKGRCTSPPAS